MRGTKGRHSHTVIGLVACLLLAGWALPALGGAAAPTAPALLPDAASPGLPRPLQVLKALPAQDAGARHEVRLDRTAAAKAVDAGHLRIDLPGREPFVAAVVAQEQHPTGDWSLTAEVATAFGPQRAVFTFGGDAAFAAIPTPSGQWMRVVSEGGRQVLEADGPVFPRRGGGLGPAHADHVVPVPGKAGGQTLRLDDTQALGLAKSGETLIDVLGLYTTELVARRGSAALVETEFTHLLALANEAYANSGANVRFRFVAFRQTDYPVDPDNDIALTAIRTNALPDGLNLHAARDAVHADLVAMLRTFPEGDSCGIAYLNGGNLNAENLDAAFGYSVNNVGPCGQFTLAHELGHNLGSAHDRAASGFGSGAYLYSFGYRQSFSPPFATVMAYAQGVETRLPQFSRPAADCLGVPCGVSEQSDNVRSLLLMAPRVALFRQPPGELHLLDAMALESRISNTTMSFRVRLSSPAPAGGVSVQYATSNLTATAGSDYSAASGTLVIPAGQSQGNINVTVLADSVVEGDETLRLTLGTVTGATAVRTVATGRIREPALTIEDVVLTEGDTGTLQGAVVVRLSDNVGTAVGFSIATVDGTAVAGSDYVAVNLAGQTLVAGSRELSIPFTVLNDTLPEGDETFEFVVSGVTGVNVADGRARVTLVDNDTPRLNFDWGRVQAREWDSSSVLYSIPVRLSRAAAGPVSFNVTSSDVDATAGVDYLAVNSTNVVIPAGQLSANIPVRIFGDTVPEPDEVFLLTVSGATGASVGQGRLEFVIRSDEGPQAAPRVTLADASVVEGNAGSTPMRFDLNFDKPVPTATTLTFTMTAGSATAGVDYQAPESLTLAVPAGARSASFVVPVLGDALAEPTETFSVSFTGPSTLIYDRSTATGSILDNDGAAAAGYVRDDRFVLRENSPQVVLSVLANDVLDADGLAGGSLRILQAPALGSATVDTAGTATPVDDRLRYTPTANTSGEDVFRYEVCTAANACRAARVQVVLRPVLDVDIPSPSHAGFRDVNAQGLRALAGLRLQASAPVKPKAFQSPSIGADPSPGSPWDDGRAGTWHTVQAIPAHASGQARTWRMLAEAAGLGGDVDLYLGVDSNGNSLPDAAELVCAAAMSSAIERCELEMAVPGTGSASYWLMLHNRSAGAQSATAVSFEVALDALDDPRLAATGPGNAAAGAAFPIRLGWNAPMLASGERMASFVRMGTAGGPVGVFPVHISRVGNESAPIALDSGVPRGLRLAGGEAQERMFIDVPAGATRLDVTVTGAVDTNLYLARVAAPTGPGISLAPPRTAASASATGPGTTETLAVTGAALQPGRWYVTPVNPTATVQDLSVTATVTATAPVVRSGSYFNAARSGHGLFLYPAGPVQVGVPSCR